MNAALAFWDVAEGKIRDPVRADCTLAQSLRRRHGAPQDRAVESAVDEDVDIVMEDKTNCVSDGASDREEARPPLVEDEVLGVRTGALWAPWQVGVKVACNPALMDASRTVERSAGTTVMRQGTPGRVVVPCRVLRNVHRRAVDMLRCTDQV